jgi:hypothetical protein
VAKPNYSYEKRQRELAKKKKKEEKAARKAHGKVDGTGPGAEDAAAEGDATAEAAPTEAVGTSLPAQATPARPAA